MKKLLIIVVTHNSEKFIEWALEDLINCQLNKTIRIVDSGSSSTDYLNKLKNTPDVQIIEKENVGFAKANNIALYDVEDFDFVLFLNPDAKIYSKDLSTLISHASNHINNRMGIFSVPLVRYDIESQRPLEHFDSLGIYCNALGRWYDRRRTTDNGLIARQTYPDAVCGAFMLVKTTCLLDCPNLSGNRGFEEKYFMYKEDIELCLRVKEKGWKVEMYHGASAYHCRGWNSDRKATPPWARWLSAKNDLDVAIRYRWRALPFAALKYLWVKHIEKCPQQVD